MAEIKTLQSDAHLFTRGINCHFVGYCNAGQDPFTVRKTGEEWVDLELECPVIKKAVHITRSNYCRNFSCDYNSQHDSIINK